MKTTVKLLRELHNELAPHIENIRKASDLIEEGYLPPTSHKALDEACHFLVHEAIPHIQGEDQILYPKLTELLGEDRTSTLMLRDHEEIANLIQQIGAVHSQIVQHTIGYEQARALTRLLYGVYTLIKIHVAREEEIIAPLLDARLSEMQIVTLFDTLENVISKISFELQAVKI
jgi:hemerythrin-like domain-containing protein